VHGDLGAAYLALNQPAKALPELDRAVALAPDHATYVSNLAYAYFLAGRLDDAIATANKACALDPKLGSAWINLGTALAKKGDLAGAERAYQRALSLDPSEPARQGESGRARRNEAREIRRSAERARRNAERDGQDEQEVSVRQHPFAYELRLEHPLPPDGFPFV